MFLFLNSGGDLLLGFSKGALTVEGIQPLAVQRLPSDTHGIVTLV
jgi:hypothetical protein